MIIVENGYVETKGTEEELFNDISSIASCFFEKLARTISKETAQEKIILAVERGFLISKEMNSQTAYDMQKLTKKIEEKVG